MVLLEYQRRNTIIHRLNPISKLIWLICMGSILSLYFDPIPILFVLATIILVVRLAGIPWRGWLSQLMPLIVMTAAIAFVNSLWLYTPQTYQRLPVEFATKSILELTPPGTPVLGRTAITYGGLIYAIGLTLRTTGAMLIFSVFIFSTAPNDIIYLLQKARIPPKATFIVMIGYRFFPVILGHLNTIMEAQTLRGWKIKTRNPLRAAKQYLPLVIPTLTITTQIADTLGLAAEARAFGAGKLTTYRTLRIRQSDVAFMGLSLVMAVVLVSLFLFYGIGNI